MKIGFIAGSFDFLHAGHIHLFKQCKMQCELLIVGLHVDPSVEREGKNKPIESVLEREIQLDACRFVDKVIVYETEEDLSIIFKYYRINVRFLGSDYLEGMLSVTDKDAVPIEYIDSLPIHSSGIRESIKNA